MAAGIISEFETELPKVPLKDHKLFLKTIRTTLESNFRTKWLHEIKDGNKNPILRTYNQFKLSHSLEPYINLSANRVYQKNISKFRLSSHCLRIHTGRFEKILPHQRYCLFCSLNVVDNEIHFLTECQHHRVERELFYSEIEHIHRNIHSMPAQDIFLTIMNSINVTHFSNK